MKARIKGLIVLLVGAGALGLTLSTCAFLRLNGCRKLAACGELGAYACADAVICADADGRTLRSEPVASTHFPCRICTGDRH